MCHLFALAKAQDEICRGAEKSLAPGEIIDDLAGNLPPMPGIWPDHPAPILRHGRDRAWQLSMARWGMPTPPQFLTGKRTDPGVMNIRNLASPHWRRWLGAEHRCLVPFTAFAEPDSRPGPGRNKPVWFTLGPEPPLAFFAGIRTEWTSTRKLKEGEVTVDAFGFLTCDANREVALVHPKAMPVVLTRPEDWRLWMTAPIEQAIRLQRPLPDSELEILREGTDE